VPKRKAAPKRKTAGRTAGAKTGAAKPAGRKAKPARRR
jgi:hypothetical protein